MKKKMKKLKDRVAVLEVLVEDLSNDLYRLSEPMTQVISTEHAEHFGVKVGDLVSKKLIADTFDVPAEFIGKMWPLPQAEPVVFHSGTKDTPPHELPNVVNVSADKVLSRLKELGFDTMEIDLDTGKVTHSAPGTVTGRIRRDPLPHNLPSKDKQGPFVRVIDPEMAADLGVPVGTRVIDTQDITDPPSRKPIIKSEEEMLADDQAFLDEEAPEDTVGLHEGHPCLGEGWPRP